MDVQPKRGSTLRALWLGQQLRELREARGLTVREAAEYIQRSAGTLSRFETAEYPIRRGDVLALLDLYGVDQTRQRQDLLGLAEDVWQTGWWDGYADAVDQQFVDYVWLEQRARGISSYDAMIVPGLAQTREYAEALIRRAEGPEVTNDQVERWVELRMARQRILDGDRAIRVSIILDESVLHRPVGGGSVLRAQLRHLLELAEHPVVEIRVLPLVRGAHSGLEGMFMLFALPEPYPQVAYVETLAGRIYVEPPKVERFLHAYDELRRDALGPKQTVKMISAAMRGLR